MATRCTGSLSNVEYEFKWIIRNFPDVQCNALLLNAQKVEVNLNDSFNHRSKWRVGCRGPQMYVKLLECSDTYDRLFFMVNVTCWISDLFSSPLQISDQIICEWTKDLRLISVDEEVTLDSDVKVNVPEPSWVNGCDLSGSIHFRIKMMIFLPESSDEALHEEAFKALTIEPTYQLKGCLKDRQQDVKCRNVKIICSDMVELKAHDIILSAQNPVFQSLLSSGMSEENTGLINVKDVSSAIMKIILHFLYTGDLLATWSDPENIVGFTYAAGKYQLDVILEMLDQVLGTKSVDANTIQLLSLAIKLNLKNAEKRLLQ